MMFTKKDYLKFAAAVAAVCLCTYFVNLVGCGSVCEGSAVTVREIRDTIPGDPVPVESPVYVPVPGAVVYVDVPVATPVDTAAILADYYASRAYVDTLRNDTSLLLVVADTVSQNRIRARSFTVQNRRPVAVHSTIITAEAHRQPRAVLYAGILAGYSPRTKTILVGPELALTVGGSVIARYGYDILGNTHTAGVDVKLTGRGRK